MLPIYGRSAGDSGHCSYFVDWDDGPVTVLCCWQLCQSDKQGFCKATHWVLNGTAWKLYITFLCTIICSELVIWYHVITDEPEDSVPG
jgi:hypothetical protein